MKFSLKSRGKQEKAPNYNKLLSRSEMPWRVQIPAPVNILSREKARYKLTVASNLIAFEQGNSIFLAEMKIFNFSNEKGVFVQIRS